MNIFWVIHFLMKSKQNPKEIIVYDIFQYLAIFAFGYFLSKTEWGNFTFSNLKSLTIKEEEIHKSIQLIYYETEEVIEFSF